jgi:hypothetical protein
MYQVTKGMIPLEIYFESTKSVKDIHSVFKKLVEANDPRLALNDSESCKVELNVNSERMSVSIKGKKDSVLYGFITKVLNEDDPYNSH